MNNVVDVVASEVGAESHAARLTARCETPAEREFLQFLHRNRYRLPDEAQGSVGIARPDFVYYDSYVCVFIDGSIHRYPDVAARDQRVRRHLETEGYTVIAIPNDPATWEAIVSRYSGTFGTRGTQR